METVLQAYASFAWSDMSTEVVGSAVRSSVFDQLAVFVRAVRFCRALPPETVLHVHLSQKGSFLREGAIVLLEGRRRRVFATIHGSTFVTTSRSRFWSLVYRAVLKRVRGVGALNSDALRRVRELAPLVPVLLLPNPGPLQAPPDKPARSGSPRVVFGGRIGRRKGIDVLIDAWEIVLAKVPQAQLVLLGPIDDDLPGSLKVKIDRYHAGVVASTEVAQYLNGAWCAVLPSRAEGQPMFLIEALGLGIPIVVTSVGGMPGLADGTGLVVPVDDAPALADALIAILTDPVLAQRSSEEATRRYQKEFSIEAHQSGLRNLYSVGL